MNPVNFSWVFLSEFSTEKLVGTNLVRIERVLAKVFTALVKRENR